jgi:hypothetical protein
MTNTTTIKAKLAAIAAAEGVSDLVADDMSSRFVWIGMDEGDQSEEVIKIYGRSEAETARIQKFIASSRTLLPGMAELWLEEIEWLEAEIDKRQHGPAHLVFAARLTALVKRLEAILP